MISTERIQHPEEGISPTDKQAPRTRNKRWKIVLGVIFALILILAALSYWWLPGYAKSQLEIHLSELLQRPVKVALIEFKLNRLELIVHDFSIGEKSGEATQDKKLFSLGKLYVDASIESIKHRAPVITSVVLSEPKIWLSRDTNDRLNIADLIEKFSQPSDEEEKGPPAKFSIGDIKIENGYFEFDDQPKSANHKISEINLGIPIIANFESKLTNWIEPHFSAKINDSPFSLEGKLRPFTEKQEATLALKLDGLDLNKVDQYASLPKGISFNSGLLDIDLLVTFTQIADQVPEIALSGDAHMRRISVKNSVVEEPYQAKIKQMSVNLMNVYVMAQKPSQLAVKIEDIALIPNDEKTPALSLADLTIDKVGIDMNKHKIALDDITLDQLRTTLRRDTAGNIDLLQLFASTDGATTKERPVQPKPAANASKQKNTSVSNQSDNKTKNTHKSTVAHMRVPLPGRKPDPNQPTQSRVAENNTPKESEKEIRKDDIKTQSIATADKKQKSEKKSSNDAPWTVQVGDVKLAKSALRYEDLSLKKTQPMVIEPLDITVRNIDLTGVKPMDLSIKARVNERGNVNMDGTLAWAPLNTDLTIQLDSVDLAALQGWAEGKINALIASGDFSFHGNVKVQQDAELNFDVAGDAKLDNLYIFDEKNAQDLLHWKKLDASSLKIVSNPLRIDINTITFSDFYARAILLPNGKLNLMDIVQSDKSAGGDVSSDVKPVETNQASQKKETLAYIGKVLLQRGNINFYDRFIKPNYRANLTGLSGQIGPLHPGKFGVIDVKGALDKTAPLEIKGKIEPFSQEFFLDLTARVKDIDLPPFSPYSGKYIGYAIEKGKLSADVQYHVEKRELTADNKIFLDQFTLGEKMESENAVSLPLDLAISLLKNRDGEINLRLPLKGSLDDPEFNLGGLVFEAFTNLISKAVTAPFTLITSVFEGGEELSTITFPPGLSEIDEETAKRLQSLAEILLDKPSLNLEISGYADAVGDHDGLKMALLQDKVKTQKLTSQIEKGEGGGGELVNMQLTPKEYSQYLTAAYKKETFKKPKNMIGLDKSLPDAEMEQLMLENIQITDNDLAILAEQRAMAAHDWLIEKGNIPDGRIYIVSASKAGMAENKGGRVEFSLK
ncbi:DUF748 domain-containing protein [Nitrosomonas sp. PY1]|uniref:DUF748 domain-containing protein n=1 Tax=Nitrosomonas sp. PY1 TaxID=1803906 RepID=UPI001FC8694B|nr:DUF748 domain-containing protein [Nitrosomonas sp. PY1]